MINNKILISLFPESIDQKDDVLIRKSIIFILSSLIGAGIFFLYGISYFMILDSQYILISNICWASLLCLNLGLYKKVLSLNVVVNISALIILIGINNVTLCLGRETTMGIYFLNIIPLTIGLYLSTYQIIFWTLLCALSYPFQVYLGPKYFSSLEIIMTKEFEAALWSSSYFVNLLIITIFVFIYMRLLKQSLAMVKAKSEVSKGLLRVITHDVKNSLNVVKTASKIIRDRDIDSEKIKSHASKIFNSSIMIDHITNQVKQMDALEAGKERLIISSISLADSLNDSISLFQNDLEKKNLKIEIDGEFDCKVFAEITALTHQVFANILSNAIKFSNEYGVIQIKINYFEDNVQIEFWDFGVGMPKKILRNIFSSNAPTSRTGTFGEKGTGFGMPILKDYVSLFGGEIQITSRDVENYPESHGTIIKLLLKKALT